MPKFKLRRNWSGYCRGYDTVEVEANTLEEAIEVTWGATDIEEEVERDDREYDEWEEA
jgi:hypothetical protein